MSTVMSREALLHHAPETPKVLKHDPHPQRVFDASKADPVAGRVLWKPQKSIWNGAMLAAALILGPLTFTPAAFALCFVAYLVGLLGQSIGMHRLLIHRSFECPLWLERVFVYLGTLAGLQGPMSWIRNHDLRDWAQCQPKCHPYLSQQGPIGRDYVWQVHCQLVLDNPPHLEIEPQIANDPFYRFIERHFYLQQLPLAVLFYALGGWSFVVWGICVRLAASVTGTWNLLYMAHNDGVQTWLVRGAGIQGYNVPYSSWLSMGEGWHNNHHAFPHSARFGMKPGETDPAWSVIKALSRLGVVSAVQTPDILPPEKDLVEVEPAPAAGANSAMVNQSQASTSICSGASPTCAAESCSLPCSQSPVPRGTARPNLITY